MLPIQDEQAGRMQRPSQPANPQGGAMSPQAPGGMRVKSPSVQRWGAYGMQHEPPAGGWSQPQPKMAGLDAGSSPNMNAMAVNPKPQGWGAPPAPPQASPAIDEQRSQMEQMQQQKIGMGYPQRGARSFMQY